MSCNSCNNNKSCGCKFNLSKHGACDPSRITINGENRTELNWNEISVPEIFNVPSLKPDIEEINDVFVNAKLDCVKLIETPFAYKIYDRVATALEIAAATAAINLAVINITPVINAVDAILAVVPIVPVVTALQLALNAVVAASDNLTTVITDALAALALPCLTAAALAAILETVEIAVNVLLAALNALITAANALGAFFASDPILGPIVTPLVTTLIDAINLIITALEAAATALLAAIGLIGTTQFFTITQNEEGTCLSGRKIIVEGTLKQKIVYTGLVNEQSVHSAHNCIPFTAYIIPYAKFEGIEPVENVEVLLDPATCTTGVITGFPFDPTKGIVVDTCEEFCVDVFVEDIFAYALDERTVFKNITLFLKAIPVAPCN